MVRLFFLGTPRVLLIVRFRRTRLRMICIIITSITRYGGAAVFAVQSEFTPRYGERRSRFSPFFIFPRLISRVTGLYPSNAISSYCFASPAKLRRLTRAPFGHLCIRLSTDRRESFFTHVSYVAILSLAQWSHEHAVILKKTSESSNI